MKDTILSFISADKIKPIIPAGLIVSFRENLKKKLRERSRPFGCFYDFEEWVDGELIKFGRKR